VKQFIATPPAEVSKTQDWSSSFATIVPMLERLDILIPNPPPLKSLSLDRVFCTYEEIAAMDGDQPLCFEGKRAAGPPSPSRMAAVFEVILKRRSRQRTVYRCESIVCRKQSFQ
jgi:hypothetical protein